MACWPHSDPSGAPPSAGVRRSQEATEELSPWPSLWAFLVPPLPPVPDTGANPRLCDQINNLYFVCLGDFPLSRIWAQPRSVRSPVFSPLCTGLPPDHTAQEVARPPSALCLREGGRLKPGRRLCCLR